MNGWCPVHAAILDGNVCHECVSAAVEVPEMRNATDKHFALPDGRMLMERSRQGPVHYNTENGWVEFEPTWVEHDGVWRLEGMPFQCTTSRHGIGYTLEDDHARFTAKLTTPRLRVTKKGIGPRMFWESKHLTIYLIAYPGGLSTHYILRSPDAPREFTWRYDGPVPWEEPSGRDNLDRVGDRRQIDETRLLEIEAAKDVDRYTIRWTGRVKALDELRRRRLTDDVLYPARMRH